MGSYQISVPNGLRGTPPERSIRKRNSRTVSRTVNAGRERAWHG